METKIKLFKLLIALFILLNVVILFSGYIVLSDAYKMKSTLKSDQNFYVKQEEYLMAEIKTIKQSNTKSYAKIKDVNNKTVELKNEVLAYSQTTQSTQNRIDTLQEKISLAINQNADLKQNIATVENKIQQQNKIQQLKTRVVKRKTRSS